MAQSSFEDMLWQNIFKIKRDNDAAFAKYVLEARRDFLRLRTRQEAALRQIYLNAADRVAAELRQLGSTAPSLIKSHLQALEKSLRREAERLSQEINNQLKNDLTEAVQLGASPLQQQLIQALKDANAPLDFLVLQRGFGDVNTRAVEAIWSRTRNGLKLSDRIWQVGENARNAMRNVILEGLAQGRDAVRIARDLEQYVNKGIATLTRDYPNMMKRMGRARIPPNLTYEALRLARTEISMAFMEGTYAAGRVSPSYRGVRWMLSGSHPMADICDELAGADLYGLGPGGYPEGQEPITPHPNCLCYVIPLVQDTKEFVNRLKQWVQDPASDPELEEWYTNVYSKLAVREPIRLSVSQALASTVEDVLEDLDRATARGVSVRKDKDVLEGQQLNVRRIMDDGRPGYELTCKITEPYHDNVRDAIRELGGTRDSLIFYRGNLTNSHYSFTRSSGKKVGSAMVYRLSDAEIVFADDQTQRAVLGQLTIRVYGDDSVHCAQRLKNILADLKLDALAYDPSPEDVRLLRLSRLAWQHAPREEIATRRVGRTAAELEDILRKRGVDPARAEKLVEREVWPGYRTFVEEGVSTRYKELGAEYLYTGVPDAESVVKILSSDSPGLMSSCERYRFGIFNGGASVSTDMEKGGADSAFARLVTRNARGKYRFDRSFMSGSYRLIIDVAELDRTDWYAYDHDAFGIVYDDFKRRPSAEEFIQRLNDNYSPSNEVMFRKGVRKESIVGIMCNGDYMRDELLEEFRRAGITEVNGKKIEDFVEVGATL